MTVYDLDPVDGRALALRHMKLDDLLHLAAEATVALGILGAERDQLGATREAYDAAIRTHLELGRTSDEWTVKVDSFDKAAVLIRFCKEVEHLDPRLAVGAATGDEPRDLHARADEVMRQNVHDFSLVERTHVWARECRLAGDPSMALSLVTRPQEFFAGTGAEVLKANFELEYIYSSIAAGDALGAVNNLLEKEEYWTDPDHDWATRGRFDQAVAVAHLALGRPEDREVAADRFRIAVDRFAAYPSWQIEGQIERLSVRVALAGLEASRDGEAAVDVCRRAMSDLESIRGRWTVVARSPSPLSLVLRVVLGELAHILSGIRGTDATLVARVGLQLSVIAKHSGVAELIRANRDVLSPRVRRLLKGVVAAEHSLSAAADDIQRSMAEDDIDRLRAKVEADVSRLLAGLALPSTVTDADVDRILSHARGRVVLDFVHLPALRARWADGTPNFQLGWMWFRTCVFGGDDAEFAALETGAGYRHMFTDGIHDPHRHVDRGVVDMFDSSRVNDHPVWRQVAIELLPDRLLAACNEGPGAEVVEILVSPHGELSRLPWAALVIDERGRRLVECATILLTPLLATYSDSSPDPGAPRALVRIVNETNLDPAAEQNAWGMSLADGSAVGLASCSVPSTDAPVGLAGSVSAWLDTPPDGGWGLVYITSHGRGHGFHQLLDLPEGELTAGAALGHAWPRSVVLNACHVGAVADDETSEPMGFVIAAMAGGAREVIGAVHVVGAPGAAHIGASIVEALDGSAPLHSLLHRAQRQLLREGADVRFWASLAAFVR